MEEIISKSTILTELRSDFTTFQAIFKSWKDTDLDLWIQNHTSSNYSEIKNFANGLRNDIDAIKNAIRYSYNNGLAEGFNNKLKSIKRSMYGRASNRLLEIKMMKSVTC